MALILHLETASPVCSVALSLDGKVVGLRESSEEKSHAVKLTLFIEELLKEHGTEPAGLDAVSLSLGPGSYTGLRIGTSVAKGFAFGAGVPLIGLPTLKVMAAGFIQNQHPGEGLLCPMLDARRMEVYTALYDSSLNETLPTEAHIIEEESFREWLNRQPVYFFGSGSSKTAEVIRHPNAIQGGPFPLSAAFQARLAEQEFAEGRFLDTAYFEPHYLKEFIASIPKNKVL
jgi:tRNA threonylcarbamoyladenosine biosynthesis protein TsaB